jgi:putative SOS response-associated peptidase YedK
MCGRTGLFYKEIQHENYNMAPTQMQPILVYATTNDYKDIPHSTLLSMKWGFSLSTLVINVRDDTRSFLSLRNTRRCVVPCSCFYEWHQKQPFCVLSDTVFYFAGLYMKNEFVIMTTRMVDSYRFLHHRMPVMLTKEEAMIWLAPGSYDQVTHCIRQEEKGYSVFAVSNYVNRVQNQGPRCIAPIKVPRQSVLFLAKEKPQDTVVKVVQDTIGKEEKNGVQDTVVKEEKGDTQQDALQDTTPTKQKEKDVTPRKKKQRLINEFFRPK